MPQPAALIQALVDLGLSATEAAVYVATVEAAAEGPVSGYRVARDLGRDPANLAKVMAQLVRRGAVTVVQQKPRLYLPVAPDAFTAGVVEHLQKRREQALEILRTRAPADQGHAPMLLPTFADALAAATGLVAGAAESVMLHASTEAAAVLAEPLAAACARPRCKVAVLSPAPIGLVGGEQTLVAAPAGNGRAWIQLICDRRRWLVARSGSEPAGCGGEQPAVAAVLADGLELARRAAGLQADVAALAAAAGGPGRVVPAAGPPQQGQDDDGLTFLIRHRPGK